MPASTLPGPHSTSVVMPRSRMALTHSTQRTGPKAWRYSASRMRSASVSTATSMLLTKGIRGAAKAVAASCSFSLSAAGFMRLEWNGAETGSDSARLAPCALRTSQAFSTAALLPAITVWAGSLKFTASTTSRLAPPNVACASAQPAITFAASMPRMAAIAPAPTGTASCIAAARKRTSGVACARLKTPEATSAEYSPSECPATTAGAAPPSAHQTRQAATPATSITGWVLVVKPSASLGPSWIRCCRSWPKASDASCKVSRTAGWSPQASSMPTDWEPWPGKRNAKEVMTMLNGKWGAGPAWRQTDPKIQRSSNTAPHVKPPPTPSSKRVSPFFT
ncbi:hypothetical protein FQZ97_787170 [compost metagenome]